MTSTSQEILTNCKRWYNKKTIIILFNKCRSLNYVIKQLKYKSNDYLDKLKEMNIDFNKDLNLQQFKNVPDGDKFRHDIKDLQKMQLALIYDNTPKTQVTASS